MFLADFKRVLYQGTEFERYLGDGQPYRCEICDDSCPIECEYIGRNDESFKKENLVFHQNCPCYCYYCFECDLNVLEDNDNELSEPCKYGDHQSQREYLLKRLGIKQEELADA